MPRVAGDVGDREGRALPDVLVVDHQDVWQRTTLAIAYVSGDARHATEVVSKAMDFIEDNVEGRVIETFVEVL